MLFGYDVVWGMMKMVIIMAWFVGAGLVSIFLLKFNPTRELINKFIDFELY